MPSFVRDQINFHYLDSGQGTPFIFQHGLGGDVNQPFGLFQPPEGVRLIAFDCRGHGQTHPLGDPQTVTIAAFADDLRTLLDHLKIDRAIIGGISMGAAIAVNFALRNPDRTLGLILSPAWLEGPVPHNVRVFTLIARLIREHGPQQGREVFKTTPDYAEVLRQSSDTAESLLRQFESPRSAERVILLERIPSDRLHYAMKDLAAIRMPTLVLANQHDPVHPFEYGQTLAAAIPGAEFKEITAKTMSKKAHTADVQRYIEEFIEKYFVKPPRRQDAKE